MLKSSGYCAASGVRTTLFAKMKPKLSIFDFVTKLEDTGVAITTFTWEPDQVWSSEPGSSRGAKARHVDVNALATHSQAHGRPYERNELWDLGYGVKYESHPEIAVISDNLSFQLASWRFRARST